MEYRVPFRGRKIWCRVVGRDNGQPPLVCVPGGPGLPHDYLKPLAALTKPARQVVFYDPLGSGHSERPSGEPWTLDAYVNEVDAVCRYLTLQRYHLFAHSAGGFVALSRALAHPPELASLVLSSTPVSLPDHRIHVRQALRQLGLTRKEIAAFEEAERTEPKRSPAYARVYAMYVARYACTVKPLPPALKRGMRGVNAMALLTMKGGLVFYHTKLAAWDVSGRLGEITVPVLYGCGRRDLIPLAAAKAAVRRMPRAELAVFEGAAHTAHLEDADAFEERVRDFLGRHDGPLARDTDSP